MVLELWLVACAAAALLVLGDLELIPLVFFGLMRSSDMANDNVKRFRVDLMGKPFEGVECGFYVEWTPDFGSNWGWWCNSCTFPDTLRRGCQASASS